MSDEAAPACKSFSFIYLLFRFCYIWGDICSCLIVFIFFPLCFQSLVISIILFFGGVTFVLVSVFIYSLFVSYLLLFPLSLSLYNPYTRFSVPPCSRHAIAGQENTALLSDVAVQVTSFTHLFSPFTSASACVLADSDELLHLLQHLLSLLFLL